MRKLLALIAVAAIVLTSCRLEAKVGLTVLEDGSGTALVEVGIDDELLGLAESFGALDVEQLVRALGVESTTGEVEERREGDMNFFSTTTAFTSLDDLEETIASFGAVELNTIDLVVDEDGATFTGTLDPAEFSASLGGIGLIDPSQLAENVSLNFDLLLPGDLGENNADQVLPDGSLRWTIAIDQPTEMNAVSSFGGDGFPIWLIALIAAGVVGVGGFLALGRNRDGGASAALAAADAPEAPRGFNDV